MAVKQYSAIFIVGIQLFFQCGNIIALLPTEKSFAWNTLVIGSVTFLWIFMSVWWLVVLRWVCWLVPKKAGKWTFMLLVFSELLFTWVSQSEWRNPCMNECHQISTPFFETKSMEKYNLYSIPKRDSRHTVSVKLSKSLLDLGHFCC